MVMSLVCQELHLTLQMNLFLNCHQEKFIFGIIQQILVSYITIVIELKPQLMMVTGSL